MAVEVSSNLFRHTERTQQINLDTKCTLSVLGFFFFFFLVHLPPPPAGLPSSANTASLTNRPAAAFVASVHWDKQPFQAETSDSQRGHEVSRGRLHLGETVASSGQRLAERMERFELSIREWSRRRIAKASVIGRESSLKKTPTEPASMYNCLFLICKTSDKNNIT